MTGRTIVVIGGTSGIGLELARTLVARGDSVVLSGRDAARAEQIAASLATVPAGAGVPAPGSARGIGLDLAEPHTLAAGLAGIEQVDGLVLAAVERDQNAVRSYDIERAVRLVTLKLVGYTEVVHALLPVMAADAATGIVLLGGRAKDRPYPGSITVSTVNGGVDGLTRALALEIAPIRVNALHPGIVGDSPFWAGKPEEVLAGYRARTPSGGLATMADVVDGILFLLDNRSVTGANIMVDCGWEVT